MTTLNFGCTSGDTRLDAAKIEFHRDESGNPKDNSSAALRPKEVGHCDDLDGIAASAPQLARVVWRFSWQRWCSSGGFVLNAP
jgi:hypothetical protein